MATTVIWKFDLDVFAGTVITVPQGAKVRDVAAQARDGVNFSFDALCLWVEIDQSFPSETRTFRVFGTGAMIIELLGETLVYVGTGHLRNGLVWHVYESLASQ